MNAARLAELGPLLSGYLSKFENCFSRREQVPHLRTLVLGQLSDLPRKSLEPVALAGGVPPRTLQHFLSLHKWDHHMVRAKVQQIVGREHADEDSIGLLDETSHVKKGTKTPGVQRQYCGSRGTTDNCAVTVHLGYADGDFHCLIDSELFLSKSWSDDRARCKAAGIPDDMEHRTKAEIAIELYDRAVANGVRFGWLTFDAGYGMDRHFLNKLNERGQRFVADVPGHFFGWLKEPPVMHKEFPGRKSYEGSGKKRKFPRIKVKANKACSLENLFRYSRDLAKIPWRQLRIKDTQKGPMVWLAKESPFFFKLDKAVTFEHRLVVCKSPVSGEVKFFLTNAPAAKPLTRIVHVAFERWRVEQCFQEEKSNLGLSHFEVRNYTSMLRHLILTGVTHLFLARVRQKWKHQRGEGGAPDRLPAAPRHDRRGPQLVADRSGALQDARSCRGEDQLRPSEHRRFHPLPQQENPETAPGSWVQTLFDPLLR